MKKKYPTPHPLSPRLQPRVFIEDVPADGRRRVEEPGLPRVQKGRPRLGARAPGHSVPGATSQRLHRPESVLLDEG